MKPEQMERQLEKWRKQERTNRVIINLALGVLGLVVVGLVTWVLVNQLRGVPTLTPSALVDQFTSWHGRKVRVRGQVELIDKKQDPVKQIRVRDDRQISVLCELGEEVRGLRDGDEITVQGTVGQFSSLIDCAIVED